MSAPDPVAAKSGFLCMYMSNHPDTLVAYVRHFGGVKTPVESAKMTKIDSGVRLCLCLFLLKHLLILTDFVPDAPWIHVRSLDPHIDQR